MYPIMVYATKRLSAHMWHIGWGGYMQRVVEDAARHAVETREMRLEDVRVSLRLTELLFARSNSVNSWACVDGW
jgi:hypothetical protein